MRHTATLKFIFLSILIVGITGVSHAQVAPPAPGSPVFVPTSAWLVGPASPLPEKSGAGMPCVMMNQYDNGYSFRIAAGGDLIYALAVDFRQPAFRPNQSYELRLSVPPGFEHVYEATAYNEATLLVNTQATPDLYKAISEGSRLAIGIGGKTLEFALVGVGEGLTRAATCFDGRESARMEPAGMPETHDRKPAASGSDSAESAKRGHGKMTVGKMVAEAAQTIGAAPEPAPAHGERRAGAAGEEGMVPDWQPPSADPPKVRREPKDIVVNYQPGAETEGLQAGADSLAGKGKSDAVRNWRAMRGANLREVLDIWSRKENVRFVWMAGQDFPIEESVSIQGTFESAVLALLEQYDGRSMRPIGKLYNADGDVAAQKVLLVELAGG